MGETTMMRVYPKDSARLAALFGKPSQAALEKLLRMVCVHPENRRAYAVGQVYDPAGAMEGQGPQVMVSGFYCGECGRYVFPAPSIPTQPPTSSPQMPQEQGNLGGGEGGGANEVEA